VQEAACTLSILPASDVTTPCEYIILATEPGAAEPRCRNALSAPHSLLACGVNRSVVPVPKLFKPTPYFGPLRAVQSLSDSDGEVLSPQRLANDFAQHRDMPGTSQASPFLQGMNRNHDPNPTEIRVGLTSCSRLCICISNYNKTPETSHFFQINCSPREPVISEGTWKALINQQY